jgi:hypothetical protein
MHCVDFISLGLTFVSATLTGEHLELGVTEVTILLILQRSKPKSTTSVVSSSQKWYTHIWGKTESLLNTELLVFNQYHTLICPLKTRGQQSKQKQQINWRSLEGPFREKERDMRIINQPIYWGDYVRVINQPMKIGCVRVINQPTMIRCMRVINQPRTMGCVRVDDQPTMMRCTRVNDQPTKMKEHMRVID